MQKPEEELTGTETPQELDVRQEPDAQQTVKGLVGMEMRSCVPGVGLQGKQDWQERQLLLRRKQQACHTVSGP